jgi:hypothetical protein
VRLIAWPFFAEFVQSRHRSLRAPLRKGKRY